MFEFKRHPDNPILVPNSGNKWEAKASFNPSLIEKDGVIHVFYRAVSETKELNGVKAEFSSIGHAVSRDGIHFKNHHELITPDMDWDKFGCEDPRVTEFEGNYLVFYTALSKFPFEADGIRVGVAITRNFNYFEKHLVTPFNAKAMALFPERINGKIAAILTFHTDQPPAKICLAFFDKLEDIWSEKFWRDWQKNIDRYVLTINHNERDHIEVGSRPIKTEKGWLFFYSYIFNYFSPPSTFGIQAAILDLENPLKIIGEIKHPFLVPAEEYELYGRVPHVIFPTGALIRKKEIWLYYGAADTVSCLATVNLDELLEQLIFVKNRNLIRFEGNPLIKPDPKYPWEAKATFNPGVIYINDKIYILYRALSKDNVSVLGYASTTDGVHLEEKLDTPVYVPREDFEKKLGYGNAGCEDPRLTIIGDKIYMCYTAINGRDFPRVAFTSIKLTDFLDKKWQWAKPVLISPPGIDNKDAALFPKKINGKYAFLHRAGGLDIWLDYKENLDFDGKTFLAGKQLMTQRETAWDSRKIGIAAPPIETKYGWLLLYHGIDRRDNHYNVRAALLDLKNPEKILYRTHDPILEPQMPYEKVGEAPNVVFPCGAVILENKLLVYYGGADKFVALAAVRLKDLIESLAHEAKFHKS